MIDFAPDAVALEVDEVKGVEVVHWNSASQAWRGLMVRVLVCAVSKGVEEVWPSIDQTAVRFSRALPVSLLAARLVSAAGNEEMPARDVEVANS